MSNQIVSDAEVEESLHWLAKADSEFSAKRRRFRGLDEGKKITLAASYREEEKGSVKDKEMAALASEAYQSHILMLIEAEDDFESLKLQKAYHETRIEIWRTLQANQRRANI